MSYIHPSWNYAGHAAIPMDQPMQYDPNMAPPPMVHPIDGYLYPHQPMEMMDYYHQPILDYEEYTENLSRPRLTKEQVETLETQFQAHPKPSSNVKRQLAAQTNLSLPRVANWFQNRRAKAKQQKRQAEYEKMQKAQAEAEEAAGNKSEAADKQPQSQQAANALQDAAEKASPNKNATDASASDSQPSSSSGKSKHHKTKSESAREATFASLQRALNAAVAARNRFRKGSQAKNECPEEEEEPVSPTTMAPPKTTNKSRSDHNGHAEQSQSFSGWSDAIAKEELSSWAASRSRDNNVNYTVSETNQRPTTTQSLSEVASSMHAMPQNNDMFSVAQYPQTGEWADSGPESLSAHGAGSDIGIAYSTMDYPMSLQPPDISISRRDSSSALTDSFEGIGICTSDASGLPQPLNRPEGSNPWKTPSKELDLAARRKRPRPAAIGTGNRSLAPSTSMSSLSPSTRMPSSGAGHLVRQSKSTQSLNSRYAGVRKTSAAQRSPLNYSTFAESGSMKSAKTERLRPSVSTISLAPPTPLTPQDLQHFVPQSPTESNYCLSAHSATQFFPTSQPMQVNIASPPNTPLDLYSPFPFQNIAPPLSAPAQVTHFPDYASCDPVPTTARSWTDAASLSSPDFPQGLQVPQSNNVSHLGYDSAMEHPGQAFGMDSVSGSPSLIYSMEDPDMLNSAGMAGGERRPAEFMMHEFPEQQEAHRFVAQQMPSARKPKAYTFANNTTPNNYP